MWRAWPGLPLRGVSPATVSLRGRFLGYGRTRANAGPPANNSCGGVLPALFRAPEKDAFVAAASLAEHARIQGQRRVTVRYRGVSELRFDSGG